MNVTFYVQYAVSVYFTVVDVIKHLLYCLYVFEIAVCSTINTGPSNKVKDVLASCYRNKIKKQVLIIFRCLRVWYIPF
jgi:hypothetical protein